MVMEFHHDLKTGMLILLKTLGNHEFDDTIAGVIPFLENVNAPFVVANIDDSEEPSIQGKYKKSIVIERQGRKIGILGYVLRTFYELSSTGKLKFLDEVETVKKEAAELKSQGVDIIIALSHAGLDVDREVAAAVSDVDVIVGGHSHSFLFSGTPPTGDYPVDSYPVIVEHPGGHKVLIVQAYAYSKYVGNISVWFDDEGEYIAWEGSPILLDYSIPEDPDVVKAMRPWKEIIDAEGSRVIGSTKVFLDASSGACRKGECNFGNLITNAFIDESVKLAQPGSWTRAAIALINSGGIRTSIFETGADGNITYADLLTAQPFENTVDIIELQGKHLLEALEFSVSRSYSSFRGNGRHKRDLEAREFSGQGFLQMSGIQVTFDLSRPVMSRVVRVAVRCAECRVPEYEPLNLEKWYQISLCSYLVSGGDGFTVIANNARNHFTGRVDYEVLIDYISKNSPIITGIEENIHITQETG
ncbi:apyrase-like isoform X2 [Zootermopsis nevadensis]|uniref:apyrase-like isoform X2 n=1 Tax=Zootermopsis nevadensis TaxID=136037 RepID=UPI000B8E85AF|nr:apyrase-like isoform X2 [Zootermopsis nevadensis]